MYAQPDHRFCRRWAVLTDPEETLGASGAGVKVFIVLYMYMLLRLWDRRGSLLKR